jgi:STE24 endopeptidase
LIKLTKDNLSFPVNDWLYSWLTHSHPPVVERIRAIRAIKAKSD